MCATCGKTFGNVPRVPKNSSRSNSKNFASVSRSVGAINYGKPKVRVSFASRRGK